MKYLLDTNTCIRYLNQRSERIIRKMCRQRLHSDDLGVVRGRRALS